MKLILISLLLLSYSTFAQLTTSNLPILIITNQSGQVIQDDPRVRAHLGVIDNGVGNMNNINDPFNNYNDSIAIEYRGSTSQQYPKKGYGFETQDAFGNNLPVGLLGMPVENDWILNGPYPDKTLIRNVLTFHLAREMGHYASRTRYCELVIDGDYRGIYILMEKIKKDGDRVDIADVHIPNQWNDTITGGYIVKVDKTTGDVPYQWTSNFNNEVIFQFQDPEYDELDPLQSSYMENYINEFEAAINGPNFADNALGWPAYIDEQSFHDFFILQELGRTVDGYRSSSFMHKDRNTLAWNAKLVAGPMWDFNLSYGNADYCDADEIYGWQYEFDDICGNFSTSIPFWWEKLLEDWRYESDLRCRWEELRQGVLSTAYINNYIDSVALELTDARIRNFQRWPIIGQYVNWNGFVGQTYQEDVDFLKTYMEERSIWIDNNLPGNCNVGIEEQEFIALYHKAWPNPFTNQLAIGFSTFGIGEVVVQIRDLAGRLVEEQDLGEKPGGAHAIEVNSNAWDRGNYIYTILFDGAVLHSGKLAKV
ncbi:MAG: hypothetical protein ACJA1C_002987 [Crocinitomicaceae bacterium]|jgi:hypothetical protein